MQIADLIPQPRGERLTRLYAGLVLYGVSDAMLLLAGLGVDPWDVLHQGLSRRIGLGVGTWVIIVGVVVLMMWAPLRQRPGFGTASNVVVIGVVMDVVLASVPAPHGLALRSGVMVAGVFLNGVATGAYIGAGLGPGPRDGLMTGLAARGLSIRVVRTGIELTVLLAGWLLGGSVGIGTVVYALGIGPLAHFFIPRLAIGRRPAGPPAAADAQPLAVPPAAADAQPLAVSLAAADAQPLAAPPIAAESELLQMRAEYA